MSAISSRWLDGGFEPTSVLPPSGGFLWQRCDEGLVGWGEAVKIAVPTGSDRFERAHERLAEAFERLRTPEELVAEGRGPVAFGSFTFDEDAPGSVLVVPQVVVGTRGGRSWVTAVGLPVPEVRTHPRRPQGPKIRYAGADVSELDWMDSVARAIKAVDAGGLEKVVLARDLRVWAEEELDVPLLLGRLARRFRECYTFSCAGLIGATPELLVSRHGDFVASLVLAGTAPRASGEADAELGRSLLGSAKDREEHRLSVDSVVRSLAPFCARLDHDSTPHLLRLANVQHLATTVTGELVEPRSSVQLAGALHPTAAICGTPSNDALELIRTLEDLDRGRYAGPVGWMDAAGDGEWGIALRCAEIDGRRGRLFAGGGVVAGSRPEAELEETRMKFRAMLSVLEES